MEQKKTVLIVEDEKNIVDIIRFNLQRTGYDTLERVCTRRSPSRPTSFCST